MANGIVQESHSVYREDAPPLVVRTYLRNKEMPAWLASILAATPFAFVPASGSRFPEDNRRLSESLSQADLVTSAQIAMPGAAFPCVHASSVMQKRGVFVVHPNAPSWGLTAARTKGALFAYTQEGLVSIGQCGKRDLLFQGWTSLDVVQTTMQPIDAESVTPLSHLSDAVCDFSISGAFEADSICTAIFIEDDDPKTRWILALR